MSVREDITVEMQKWINEKGDCILISPTALAAATMRLFEEGKIEPHIEYTSLEHLKQIARDLLRKRFDDEGEQNPSYAGDQGELFSGHLQDRYPIRVPRGADPQYKLRVLLTNEERAWNVELLRKSASSRLAHADALEAEGMGRQAAA